MTGLKILPLARKANRCFGSLYPLGLPNLAGFRTRFGRRRAQYLDGTRIRDYVPSRNLREGRATLTEAVLQRLQSLGNDDKSRHRRIGQRDDALDRVRSGNGRVHSRKRFPTAEGTTRSLNRAANSLIARQPVQCAAAIRLKLNLSSASIVSGMMLSVAPAKWKPPSTP
jgi:hypothetical protein